MAYFGIGTDSSFFSSYFGNSNSSTTSDLSSASFTLGDYALIKSGSYKKLLKQYYAENGNDKTVSTIKSSAQADSTTNLLSIKTSAENVKKKAEELSAIDVSTEDRAELLKKVNSFIESYNGVLDATENIESVAILQNAIWMKNQVEKNENILSKVGITIGEENELKVDDSVFKKATAADLSTVFSGRSSVVSSISQRASQIYNIAGAQAVLNSRTSSYTDKGSYNTITSSNLINSLL